MSEETADWLERHGRECRLLAARITPAACATYRRGRRALNCMAWVTPWQCEGCPGMASEPLPERRRQIVPARQRRRKGKVDAGPKVLRPRGAVRQLARGGHVADAGESDRPEGCG